MVSVLALSTPGGDDQDQGLLQVLFDSISWGMNAENAVEAPRFQTEHLVSSFDNHAMTPGSLYIDERIPSNVAEELAKRGHKITIKSRYDSGTAPVLIRLHPTGLIEAGADPFYYPGVAGVVGPLFDEPGGFDRDALAEKLRALARAEHLHRRQFVEVRRLARADLLARAISFARQVFAASCSKRNACANTPKRFPLSAAISLSTSSPRMNSGASYSHKRRRSFGSPSRFRSRSLARCFRAHARYGPQAGKENEEFLNARVLQEMFLRPLAPYREQHCAF